MNFAKFVEEAGRKMSAGPIGPATSPALRAVLAAGEQAENRTNEDDTKLPGALIEKTDPGPVVDPALSLAENLSSVEEALGITASQARMMKDELLQVGFSTNERTADRLKALQMLIDMSALNKRDRIRDRSRPNNNVNVFNVLQTVKDAQNISRTSYEADADGN